MAPPGLSALGAKGSVRDRLTPPGRVEGFRPREVYSTVEVLHRTSKSAKEAPSLPIKAPSCEAKRPAPKAQDGSTQRCERLCEAIRLPPVIPTEVEGSFLQTGKS